MLVDPFLCIFPYVCAPFLLFSCLWWKKYVKMPPTNNFVQQTVCEAPIRWSKYTTLGVIEVFNLCLFFDIMWLFLCLSKCKTIVVYGFRQSKSQQALAGSMTKVNKHGRIQSYLFSSCKSLNSGCRSLNCHVLNPRSNLYSGYSYRVPEYKLHLEYKWCNLCSGSKLYRMIYTLEAAYTPAIAIAVGCGSINCKICHF